MRQVWLAGVFGALIALGARAVAQTSEPVTEPPIIYDTRLVAAEIDDNFPREAYRSRQDGQASLCCLVRPNGSLQCAVVAEAPLEAGFGEAARRVSSNIRLSRESTAGWRAYGQPMRLRINFRGPHFTPAPPFAGQPRCGTATRAEEAIVAAED